MSETGEEQRIEKIAKGQKYVLYAILMSLLGFVVYAASLAISETLAMVMSIVYLIAALMGLGLGWVGIFHLATGLGSNIVVKVLLFLLMFVPIINVVTLLALNSTATRRLRNAGYKVGLLGVSS